MENEFTNLEQPPQVEASSDKKVETKKGLNVERVAEKVVKTSTAIKQPQVSKVQENTSDSISVTDAQTKQIESVLADGLDDYYKELNPADQQKFKQSGEEAAREVSTLLQKTVVKLSEIIGVIKKWLSSVPGLNKFFIEQSAKIKADKVLIIGRKDQ